MSSQEQEPFESPKVERGWNHARFSVATRLPTAVARARMMQRGVLNGIKRASKGKR